MGKMVVLTLIAVWKLAILGNAFTHLQPLTLRRARTSRPSARDILFSSSSSEVESEISPCNNDKEEMDINMRMAKHTLLSVAASIMCIPPEIFTTPPMIDPNPPSTPAQRSKRTGIMHVLKKGWRKPTDGFHIPQDEIDFVDEKMGSNNTGHSPSTYGEITELGARQLFDCMGLVADDDDDKNDANFTFVDLGCGSGKLLIQAYMELPHVTRIVGIELATARHALGVRAWELVGEEARGVRMALQTEADNSSARVLDANLDIIQGDLYGLDLSTATHIYVASLCFTEEMMNRLAEKLVAEASQLKCVATLKPFSEEFNEHLCGTHSGGWEDYEVRKKYVEMSWTKPRGQGCTVYFYHK